MRFATAVVYVFLPFGITRRFVRPVNAFWTTFCGTWGNISIYVSGWCILPYVLRHVVSYFDLWVKLIRAAMMMDCVFRYLGSHFDLSFLWMPCELRFAALGVILRSMFWVDTFRRGFRLRFAGLGGALRSAIPVTTFGSTFYGTWHRIVICTTS